MNCSIKYFSKTKQIAWCEEVEDYKWFSIEPAIFKWAEKSDMCRFCDEHHDEHLRVPEHACWYSFAKLSHKYFAVVCLFPSL